MVLEIEIAQEYKKKKCGQVKFSLCLNTHHALKTDREVEVLHHILTWEQSSDVLSALCFSRFGYRAGWVPQPVSKL
jgi:hypothetical protein